jgi:hypothetical protein
MLATALLWAVIQSSAAAQAANVAEKEHPDSVYRIAGTVVSKIDGHPLSRARVVIRDAKNPDNFHAVITAEDGKFDFPGLPAGKYGLEGAKRGFIPAGYDQHDQFATAIVTGAGLDTENLVLKLAPDAVITGRVLDEAGEPVRHATVQLYRDDNQQGVDQIHPFRGGQSDDLGTYEIAQLPPGTYFLSASAQPWYATRPQEPVHSEPAEQSSPAPTVDRSLDVAYPTTYYGDVTEAQSATPIPVRGSERVQVDIHLNPVPALRLILHVPESKTGYVNPQLEQSAFDGSTYFPGNATRLISPGVWELAGIPAGRYNIRIQGPDTASQINGVDLSTDGEHFDTSTAQALSEVKVSVQVPGEVSVPAELAVALRAKGRALAGWQRLDPKGEAEIRQIPAGDYEVLLFGGRKPYSISRISAEGAEVSGHSVTVPVGASVTLSLSLVQGNVEIEGTVKRAGKVFAGAMVVLVPKYPEGNRDLFRRDQSDLDGTFSLHGVIPGSYTLLAIENGWDLDWSEPGVIAAYLKRGQTIEVGNRPGQPIRLTEAIEVQSK